MKRELLNCEQYGIEALEYTDLVNITGGKWSWKDFLDGLWDGLTFGLKAVASDFLKDIL